MAVDTTVEERASMAEAEAMVAAASTGEAEATVVGTGNLSLERIQRAGSIELPALLFLQLVASLGSAASLCPFRRM